MKKTLISILWIILSISIFAQNQKMYEIGKLNSGSPQDIELIIEHLGLKDISYVNLETKVDSVKIVFGKMTQGDIEGYWISSFFNSVLKSFSTVSLKQEKSSDFFSNNLDIDFDNSTKRISLHLKYNPSKKEVLYEWLDGKGKSEKLSIQTLDKPLQINKPLPYFNLTSLTGENISLSDYKGKLVVINWWATTCAPCRDEIPGLNQLVDKFDINPNVIFLAIAFDEKDRLENFLKYHEFKYSQTYGDNKISKIFGESFPKNIIVNPEGVIIYYSEGGHKNMYLEIEKKILNMLN